MAGTEQAQVKFPMVQLKKMSISSLLGLPLLWLMKAYFNTKVSLGKSPVPHCCGGDCLFCGSAILFLLMIREVHVLCSVVNQAFIVFARELESLTQSGSMYWKVRITGRQMPRGTL